jgi:hypothetical protein
MESSKPARQAPAGQKVAEPLFDESGQAFTVALRRRLETERLEVCDDNLMKHAVSRISRQTQLQGRQALRRAPAVRRDVARQAIPDAGERFRDSADERPSG